MFWWGFIAGFGAAGGMFAATVLIGAFLSTAHLEGGGGDAPYKLEGWEQE